MTLRERQRQAECGADGIGRGCLQGEAERGGAPFHARGAPPLVSTNPRRTASCSEKTRSTTTVTVSPLGACQLDAGHSHTENEHSIASEWPAAAGGSGGGWWVQWWVAERACSFLRRSSISCSSSCRALYPTDSCSLTCGGRPASDAPKAGTARVSQWKSSKPMAVALSGDGLPARLALELVDDGAGAPAGAVRLAQVAKHVVPLRKNKNTARAFFSSSGEDHFSVSGCMGSERAESMRRDRVPCRGFRRRSPRLSALSAPPSFPCRCTARKGHLGVSRVPSWRRSIGAAIAHGWTPGQETRRWRAGGCTKAYPWYTLCFWISLTGTHRIFPVDWFRDRNGRFSSYLREY